MIKEIVHDPFFLGQKSEIATKQDIEVAQDLLDTLIANNMELSTQFIIKGGY